MDESGTTSCSMANEESSKTLAPSDFHHNSSSITYIQAPGAPFYPSPPPDYDVTINSDGGSRATQSTFGKSQVPYVGQSQIPYVQATPIIPDHEAPDHLVMAILVTFCCCLPLGIVAILKSKECQSARLMGDREKALRNGREAKKYSLIGIGCGIVILVLLTVYYLYILNLL